MSGPTPSPHGRTPAADALYARDASAAAFAISLVEATPDRAVVTMAVRADMCNGFGIAHGGITFLLADSAMAFASNARGATALASSAEIDWLAPVPEGTTLTATAERRWQGGRSNLWDVTVTAGTGDTVDVVAVMRGRTRDVGTA